MSCELKHIGTIVEVTSNSVTVLVEQRAACAGCASQASCTIPTEKKDENIVVPCSRASEYAIGEKVRLVTTQKKLYTALFWAYILPLIGLLGMVIGGIGYGLSEAIAATAGLLFCLLYAIVLKLLPQRITKPLQIEIEKL